MKTTVSILLSAVLCTVGIGCLSAQSLIETVEIPAGSFYMGSNGEGEDADEAPVHRVTISQSFRMGKTEDAAYFSKRADFYKNLFDPTTKFMRPRKSDGTWKSPFDPTQAAHAESNGGDYTEGNAWQYTWHVQHDVPGLIALLGGEEAFTNKLDSLFTVELRTQLADVTGLIGNYAHGNEPSHHVTYLYTLAGKPERTADHRKTVCQSDNIFS